MERQLISKDVWVRGEREEWNAVQDDGYMGNYILHVAVDIFILMAIVTYCST